jgi:hypothetical protein
MKIVADIARAGVWAFPRQSADEIAVPSRMQNDTKKRERAQVEGGN